MDTRGEGAGLLAKHGRGARAGAPPEPPHVLIVDDEPWIRRSLARILSSHGFRVSTAEDGVEGLALLRERAPDVVLVDMQMPRMGGLEMLARAKEEGTTAEIIVMTAHAGVNAAVDAVKRGAYHFLTKPFLSTEAVAVIVAQAADHKELVSHTRRLEEKLDARERFGELIGTSPKMTALYRIIEGVSTTTATVLILGATGTGKELVARAIHERSARADRPFLAVNCAAIPKELVESELFGHVRGAFTGAHAARAGLFEAAHRGTLFLDEVGDLPLAAQVKLLRVLQEGEVKRVGADETKLVDVRILAATNVDLKPRIAAGTFRSDLFYRLNVIALELPALRERDGDITLLAHHFIHKYSQRLGKPARRLSPAALQALLAYAWPGNVRELEHAIERAVVLSQGDAIEPTDLSPEVAATLLPERRTSEDGADEPGAASTSWWARLAELPYAAAKKAAVAQFEEAYVEALLHRTGGNVSEAARQAATDRSNFKRLMHRAKG